MNKREFWWDVAKAGFCLAAVVGVVMWGYVYTAWVTTSDIVGRNTQRLEVIERTKDRFYRSEFDAWVEECRKQGFDFPDATRNAPQD